MKKLITPLTFIFLILSSCSSEHSHKEGNENSGLEALAYTLYTDKTELFVEFDPLVKDVECRFAAHFTALGDSFTPFTEGTITLTAEVNGKVLSVTANEPDVPGIFRLHLTPNTTGLARLTFDIKTKSFNDRITIDSVNIYPDQKSALASQSEKSGGSYISFLKEQAWKIEFANEAVRSQAFSDVIRTSGQILSAPGDEIIVSAKASGIVRFSGSKTIAGSEVEQGTELFIITGGDLTEENIDSRYKEAKANYEKAKLDFERAAELVKDKIVSESAYQQAKLHYESAETTFNNIARNYSAKGHAVMAGMSGFIRNIMVTEGQFVESGDPLAIVSKNKKLILQANVSQKYFDRLSSITSANFRTSESEKVFSTTQLNGKLMSYGRSASANSPFIPVSFEMDNTGNLIPGSVVEVFLKSYPIPDAFVVPLTALIEEQANFFVYVQKGGESFEKRELKIGASDGMHVQVLSGLMEGERVVTKGAYQIKLSAASGTMPEHGHEH